MKSTINLSVIDAIAIVLVAIGALNWGLVGMAHFLTSGGNWNIVNQLLGSYATIEFGVYLLVGLAALWTIYMAFRVARVGRTAPGGELEPEPGV